MLKKAPNLIEDLFFRQNAAKLTKIIKRIVNTFLCSFYIRIKKYI
jgi:hypothetical protein